MTTCFVSCRRKRIGKRVSAPSGLRERYADTCRTAAAHRMDPVLFSEGTFSAERVYEVMRESETGYNCLGYLSSVQVDSLDNSSTIRDSFRVQLKNPKGSQSSWLEEESAKCVTVADVREPGRDLKAFLSSLCNQVQAAWGVEVDFPCFVEALRHELHQLSASSLSTAYVHNSDPSGRPYGPTLVRVQTSQ